METLRGTRLPITGSFVFDAKLRLMASDREAVKLGLVHLALSLVWITVSLLVAGWFLENGNSTGLIYAVAQFVNTGHADAREAFMSMTVLEAIVVLTVTCGLFCAVTWVLVTRTVTNVLKTLFCAYRGYELAKGKVAQ